ncbi:unnamed protein product [Ostreobium quekettii]|uniref:Uncharacterized protein n=1 Tax=Ostreobium quekettii TaxID=121088 RepID=A0A8S1J4F0_9CHLO|nr:unnamed protein product [Ostreobium quekettii]|eukprot:evm.model.scf_484.5 EVM.evm.TU.scf_484.5   scf_484:57736-59596(-)
MLFPGGADGRDAHSRLAPSMPSLVRLPFRYHGRLEDRTSSNRSRSVRKHECKTWGEIAEGAEDVAKATVDKTLNTGKAALKIVRKSTAESPTKTGPATRQRTCTGRVSLLEKSSLLEGLVWRGIRVPAGGAISGVSAQARG